LPPTTKPQFSQLVSTQRLEQAISIDQHMSVVSQGLVALVLALATHRVSSVNLRRGAPRNGTLSNNLVGRFPQNVSFQAAWKQPPCQCIANDPAWVRSTRTTPKCIFIDLGAADGNTFQDFLQNKYGPVSNCPSGDWEAFLVEANPQFDAPLKLLEQQYAGQVHALASTAAFTCEGQTSFYIDTDPTHNHWGSSMNTNSPDVVKSGKQQVTVPTTNVIQLIAEHVLPGDWVMLKVDVEGAEYELVPCLAEYKDAGLIDRMYLEEHWWFKTDTQTTPEMMAAAKAKLQSMHVDIPQYYSPS
jgi:FkbM family methyltransferase